MGLGGVEGRDGSNDLLGKCGSHDWRGAKARKCDPKLGLEFYILFSERKKPPKNFEANRKYDMMTRSKSRPPTVPKIAAYILCNCWYLLALFDLVFSHILLSLPFSKIAARKSAGHVTTPPS